MASLSSIRNTSDPATSAEAITNGVAFSAVCRGIYVGGAGAVNVQLEDGTTTVLFSGAAAGSIIPIRARQVLAASTTATNLVALF